MIQNLQSMSDMPAARTNLIRLQESQLETVRRLLAPVSNVYMIDFALRQFKKERKEGGRDFHVRIHREVKQLIRKTLDLPKEQDVKYELIRLQTGEHAFFFLNNAADPSSQAQQKLMDRIQDLCHQLTSEEHSLNQLVQGLFGLHLKMVMLEQATARFSVEPVYFNAKMYLNARITRPVQKKSCTGVMEAFDLNVFASVQNELAFTLHKRKFLVAPAEELNVALDDETVWFNTASGRMIAKRSLDARDNKLDFFKERSSYGECQAYTYNVVMNVVRERLQALDIPFNEIIFQASHEVDNYITDLDNALSNRLYVVNAGLQFSPGQEVRFFGFLKEHLPYYTLISKTAFTDIRAKGFLNWKGRCSVLVLNAVHDNGSNSIRQLNANDTEGFSSFFAAYFAHKEKLSQEWDLYTALKIQRLEGWLNENPLPVVLQGINIDENLLDALDYINELERLDPAKFAEDLSKPKSLLKVCFNRVANRIRRIKTELWFKEVMLSTKVLSPLTIEVGHYTAYFVRITENSTTFLGHIELTSDGKGLTIEKAGVTEGDLAWLATEHEPLKRVTKLYNDSFYLYDHDNDALLTTYNSIRVPRIIGPTAFDAVEWYAHQEVEKTLAEQRNEKFTEFFITRSAKPHMNVLPYYLAPGRSKKDPLAKSDKLKHHHIYLQPHDGGLYILMTSAQPANSTITKQILIEHLLIWDADGQPMEVFGHPLTSVYLNSFTLDMLKSGESSKTSVFAKLAKLMVEN